MWETILRRSVQRHPEKAVSSDVGTAGPRVLLPRPNELRIRSAPKGAPDAKDLRVADAAVQMYVARLELRLLVYRNALIAAVLDEEVAPVAPSPRRVSCRYTAIGASTLPPSSLPS